MPKTKILRKRGAVIVVTAYGETLFAPSGPVPGFTRRLSNSVTRGVRSAAPRNKRPRWAHYGPPLKNSFTSTSRANPAEMRSYFAVGSKSSHALYPDQGTGVYAGGGPYEARILPPWEHGSPSLYEKTWKPPGGSKKNNMYVIVKGQKGQFYFDEGMKRGMAAMGIANFYIPRSNLARAFSGMPQALVSQVLGSGASPTFLAQLKEWREWRDSAYKANRMLGKDGGRGTDEYLRRQEASEKRRADLRAKRDRNRTSPERRAELARLRQKKKRERDAIAKGRTPASQRPKQAPKPQDSAAAVRERIRFMGVVISRYPAAGGAQVGVPRFNAQERRWYVSITLRNGTTTQLKSREVAL